MDHNALDYRLRCLKCDSYEYVCLLAVKLGFRLWKGIYQQLPSLVVGQIHVPGTAYFKLIDDKLDSTWLDLQVFMPPKYLYGIEGKRAYTLIGDGKQVTLQDFRLVEHGQVEITRYFWDCWRAYKHKVTTVRITLPTFKGMQKVTPTAPTHQGTKPKPQI